MTELLRYCFKAKKIVSTRIVSDDLRYYEIRDEYYSGRNSRDIDYQSNALRMELKNISSGRQYIIDYNSKLARDLL